MRRQHPTGPRRIGGGPWRLGRSRIGPRATLAAIPLLAVFPIVGHAHTLADAPTPDEPDRRGLMPTIAVDLQSDTVTKPTQEMRRFMCEAEVGDEQKGADPTVNTLQAMVAELLGKDAALFLPSGTMCNEIAMRVHCRPGEEMLAHRTAHPIHFETGGPAALAGINVQGLDGPRGQFDFAAVEAAIRPDNRHMPRSRLLWVGPCARQGSLPRVESMLSAIT